MTFPSVNATIATILCTPGPSLSEFLQENSDTAITQNLEKLQKGFVLKVAKNLQSRFPQTTVISAISILDPQNLPKEKENLSGYGISQLDILLKHFSSVPYITPECKEEWSCLKQLAFTNYCTLTLQEFWILIARKHKEQFPCLLNLHMPAWLCHCQQLSAKEGLVPKIELKRKLETD